MKEAVQRVARAGAAGLLALAAAGACALAAAWLYSLTLPPLDLGPALRRSTVVLDRNGRLLRPFATPDGRWRLPASPDDVDPRYLAMLKAYEDRRFDGHPGVDPVGILRAGWQWLRAGRIVSGGSTLSMQVARLVEPRPERSLASKLRQGVRAIELERRLGKEGVLELYLALAPYGGAIEGARAASLAYFGREPKRLSDAEAALLVALPQAPESRRPDRFAQNARRARDRVLDRAASRGLLGPAEVAAAKAEPIPTARFAFPMLAAHAAESVLAQSREQQVHRLTIDARLQGALEGLARERAVRAGPGLSAAILVIENATGAIRVQVGSAGYLDRSRAGAIDMTGAIRSPGSALKPFVYALAFDSGVAHPETLLDDRPVRFGGSYAPENFDLSFQGTVTARRALQLSLNVPAVELLDAVGAARFVARLRGAGVEIVLPRAAAPGLPIALGGVGITLTDLARLYAGLARGGSVPGLQRRIGEGTSTPTASIAEPVAAWYVADILRGAPPPENALTGRIAFKTGTSYGYRDAWAVGFDRRFTIAVWTGQPDGAAVPGLVGRTVAAPILFDAFARLGGEMEPIPMPKDALLATTASLPPPLRHIRRDVPKSFAAASGVPLRIAYPPDGSRVDLGLSAPDAPDATLALKVQGGVPPLTWLVNNSPVGTGERRQAEWRPDGAGFARISVMDAAGASDSVLVRIE